MRHKDLSNPYYTQWIHFLDNTESWSCEDIRHYQLAKLQSLADTVWNKTKGYRKLWEKFGVSPKTLQSLDDIRSFPCITKQMLCEEIDQYTVMQKDMEPTATGGSTGISLNFYRTKQAFGRELASKAHQYYRVGWREGDPQIVFRGIPIENKSHMQFFPEFNELRCSSYHMLKDDIERYRQCAFEYAPKWLRCYPSSGYRLARYILDTKKTFPKLNGILVSSENLYDFQKVCMEKAFNCRIFNHYGQFEQVALAGYCEKADTFHVLPQYSYVELLDAQGNPVTTKGVLGEIVGTSFLMDATCFFRYKTNDFAVYETNTCPLCKRPYLILKTIEGRLQDFIVTKTNRYISITAMNMHDDIFSAVKQFQYYQDTKGSVVLKYIPKKSNESVDEEDIKKRLHTKLGEDVELILQKVQEGDLIRSRSGKFLYMHQKLPMDAYNVYKQ